MKEVMNYKQKQLVTAHLSLVPRMVRSLTRSFTYLSQDEFDELTQTGYLALCNAAMKCSPAQPFPPYATEKGNCLTPSPAKRIYQCGGGKNLRCFVQPCPGMAEQSKETVETGSGIICAFSVAHQKRGGIFYADIIHCNRKIKNQKR